MIQYLIDRWPVVLVQVTCGLVAWWVMQREGE